VKVTQIIPDYGLGGIQKAGCVLGKGLAELGCPTIVIGMRGGPRFEINGAEGAEHIICGDEANAVARVRVEQPDVIHIHAHSYAEQLIKQLLLACPRTVMVTTPVFGRPPANRALLRHTRTCTVGVYTFYRLRRWLRWSATDAVSRGVGYVPLTPYFPLAQSSVRVKVEDLDASRLARRDLDLDADALYVGRIGRATVSKWHPDSEKLVNRVLELRPAIRWISVGMPDQLGGARLSAKWGRRFVNLPETSDPDQLARIMKALDIQLFFSRHGECFASSIAEAAGSGVPTIALSTPFHDNGQAEQVMDGVTGYLVTSIEQAMERVSRLHDHPSALRALQASTAAHALDRWHYRRVASDLLSLYEYWRGNAEPQSPPPYVATMLTEDREFASYYNDRVTTLAATSRGSQLALRLCLSAYENWMIFAAGRAIKSCAARVASVIHAL